MSSDAARAEAERRWPLWLPTGDPEIDAEGYSEVDAKWQNEEAEVQRAAFVAGAEWQAELAERRARAVGMREEWALARPASMPDMSGKPTWTIVGGPFDQFGSARYAWEKPRSALVNGEPPVIVARKVTPWELVDGEKPCPGDGSTA